MKKVTDNFSMVAFAWVWFSPKFKRHAGLNPTNKNYQNSENFHRFSNCVPLKIFGGKFSKSSLASCTKIFVWKFIRFSGKWVGSTFSDFCQKIFQNSNFSDRIKPSYSN